jgi:hypothetical protein
MPDQAAEGPPAASPMSRHGQLEVDAFCAGCGYNLHGQIVSLDERLGFAICRCPECGRYHPAGAAVTSNSLWLRRFAASLLTIWVLVVLVVCFLLGLAMFALQAGSVDGFLWTTAVAPDGRPVIQQMQVNNGSWGYVIVGTTTVVTNPRFIRTPQPPANENPRNIANNHDLAMINLGSILLGFLAGTLLVTFLWHWSRRRYIVGILLPMIAAGFLIGIYCLDDQYELCRAWCVRRLLTTITIQIAGIFLGILLGRKVSRTIANMVIPPKPRQMLAFLWIADGKAPPTVHSTPQ